MSSDKEDSVDLSNEVGIKSDPDNSGSNLSPTKLQQSGGEHARPRKKRRGKNKRKQRKESGSGALSETAPDGSPTWDSDQELDSETNHYTGLMIRPIDAPQAPKNSTQFIMDDHNECRLYMSFETPNPYLSSNSEPVEGSQCVIEPAGQDAAYIDIDYEYESPQDFDNSAYYDREFEQSYKSNRFEELLRLPREELISGLQALESKLKELTDDLVKENPNPILEKLQAELLELQEKHHELKETNSKLTELVMQNESNDTSADGIEETTTDVSKNEEDEEQQMVVSSSSEDKDPEIESRLQGALCISENGRVQSGSSIDDISFHGLKKNSPSFSNSDCDELPHSTVPDDAGSVIV